MLGLLVLRQSRPQSIAQEFELVHIVAMVTIWPRQNFVTGGGPGAYALVALSSEKLADPLPVSRSRHGMPTSEGAGAVALVVRDRATDPTWFDDNIVAPFVPLIENDLDAATATAAARAQFAYIVTSDVHDPEDLSHVQAGWALAKCICEQGAAVVIDVTAARAHNGTEVAGLAPDRSFDVMHEVTLFFDEREDEDAGESMIAWTAGMQKFGRPNLLITDIARDYAAVVATVLRDAATTLAEGERLEIGDTLTIGDRTFVATPLPEGHDSPIDGAAVALAEVLGDAEEAP